MLVSLLMVGALGVLSQLFEQEMCCKFEDRNLGSRVISVSRPLLAQSVSRQSDSPQARKKVVVTSQNPVPVPPTFQH